MSSPLRIGKINYINSLPLFSAFEEGEQSTSVEFISGPPTTLNRMLREGDLDGGTVSVTEYLNNRDQYTLLDPFCIASTEQVLSVNLYSRLPLRELDGVPIGLTPESAASVNLLRVLCEEYWGVSPQWETFASMEEWRNYNAFLLIGDQALLHLEFPGYTTYDLAQQWYRQTGLSFVFGIFVIHRSVFEERYDEVLQWKEELQRSLQWAKRNMAFIERKALERIQIAPAVMHSYFRSLCYELGEKERKGFELFSEKRERLLSVYE